MSRFFSEKFAELEAYVPGEQPRDQQVIKLNTNESPFPPPPEVEKAVTEEWERLRLYPDPEGLELRKALAQRLGISPEEVLMTNGSDEALNFAFMAFCDRDTPAVFADITYGFYPVYARVNQVPFRVIPLKEDLSLDPKDYLQAGGTVFIANPNAPTGLALRRKEIEDILKQNRDHVVVIDEAYVDFGAESCVPLIRKYDNLLVVQTFSKSRSLAGGRLGMAIGNAELIRDLNTIKYSTNPYNIDRLTMAAGIATLKNDEYNRQNCAAILRTRKWTAGRLKEMGFDMPYSSTNFLFVRHPAISGEELYRELKNRGILVRHFDAERIRDYNRITIGTREQMEHLADAVETILEGRR